MKKWGTEIYAKCNVFGEIKTFIGQSIDAPSKRLAQEYCVKNFGYLHVTDELIAEIDAETGDQIDYENTQNN